MHLCVCFTHYVLSCCVAYQTGYSSALQDVLEYLQQGLDIEHREPSESIAQIIDYIEVSNRSLLYSVVRIFPYEQFRWLQLRVTR